MVILIAGCRLTVSKLEKVKMRCNIYIKDFTFVLEQKQYFDIFIFGPALNLNYLKGICLLFACSLFIFSKHLIGSRKAMNTYSLVLIPNM